MGGKHIDTRLLADLTEQSQDLNSDALRITKEALADYLPGAGPPPPRRWWRGGAAKATATAAAGAAAPSAPGTPAAAPPDALAQVAEAAKNGDIVALQTAASLENLAVNVYKTASGLSFIKNGDKTVAAFITTTTKQHQAHAKAFNAAATQAGGKAQRALDPKYAPVIQKVLPTLKSPADVVMLAITLEDVAAQTYTKNVSRVADPRLRQLFASVAPVEAQHRATLLAVQSLLTSNHDDLIAMPTNAGKLPAAVGRVGFPNAFYPTRDASPISEGAVQ